MQLGSTIRTVVGGLAAVALSAGLIGAPHAVRADHCQPIVVFSGHSAEGEGGPKPNPGTAGCLFVNHDDANLNTNYLVPGANAFSVAVFADPRGVTRPGEEGTATVKRGKATYTYRAADGTETTETVRLTLTWNGARWNSQEIVADGVLIRATAKVPTQPGVVVSTTYRAIGEEA